MRKINFKVMSILMVLLFICFGSVDAAQSEVVCFFPEWQQGDMQRYKFTKQVLKNDIIVSESKTTFTITVIDVLDDGYILEWKNDDMNLTNIEQDDLSKIILKMVDGVVTRYKVDEYGTFVEFTNLPELKKTMYEISNTVAEQLETDEEKNQFKQFMSIILGSDEQLTVVLSKSISLLHNPYIYGYEFETGEEYVGEVSLPNPWGGQPLSGIINITASSYQDNMNEIVISQILDKTKSAEVVNDIIKTLSSQLATMNISEDMFIETIEINDEIVSLFKENSNWLSEIKLIRTAKILNDSQVEIYNFEAIE
ncbi:MAG: hypothetical protein KAX49_11540 [Halanaerobiales bacterium]|nr:hypothetical protein [Halanaerobiales bacterium]